jgi:hypothetical protein
MENVSRNKGIDKQRQIEVFDSEFETTSKIPESANDLIVITKTKKLGAYIFQITEKSPAKFRGTIIKSLHGYVLSAIENLTKANFIRMDGIDKKKMRENFQLNAITDLKMLGYIATLAESSGCILTKQLKQIAMQLGESINLAAAWKKNDDERFKQKH